MFKTKPRHKFFDLCPKAALSVLFLSAALLAFPEKEALAQRSFIMASPEQFKAYSFEQPETLSYIVKAPMPVIPKGRSRAPEPPTMILLIGGMVGVIIRFAQKSFLVCKRIMNHVLSVIAIIMAAPLLLLIALLVRVTSKGPIIYRQQRVGKYGHNFMMYKFRTMTVDAEKGVGAVWARENDPRVTPVGGFLRKTHLDELPQFFNVLMGEMNIVGPRPERPEIVKDLREKIVDYDKRLNILPGITGLAQVLHRADETLQDVRKKVKYDLFYIRKMCWFMELRVLASTVFVMLSGKTLRFKWPSLRKSRTMANRLVFIDNERG